MKLIASPTSPFARKIRVALLEKNLACEVHMDVPWNEGTQVPDYNPLGKIPVLALADGATVFDSRVIAEYLDTLPAPRLIPEDPAERIAVRRLEALADGISDAAAAIYLEFARRPPAQQSADWVERQRLKVSRGLRVLAAEYPAGRWFMEDHFSLADIAAGCMLGYLTLRLPDIHWRADYPALAALQDRLEQRPSFAATRPQP